MDKKFVLLLVVLLFVPFCFAVGDVNKDINGGVSFVPSQKLLEVRGVMDEVRGEISELSDNGFSLSRIRDEFLIARQEYVFAFDLERKQGVVDYSRVVVRLDKVRSTIDLAREVGDELVAVKIAAKKVEGKIDTSQVYEIISRAEQEFRDERYERSKELINEAYEKIISLQSVQAKASVLYEATKKNLVGFFVGNWKLIVGLVVGLFVFWLLFRKRVKRFFIVRKIGGNEGEVLVLKGEIKKAQKRYFVDGVLSEGDYSIKVKFFSERIRDLNKDNAVLAEELEGSKKRK